MKKLCALLLVAVLMSACALAEGPRLPDIGPLIGVEGELYRATEEKSGPYHSYLYKVEMTIEEASAVIVYYTEAARETGFDPSTHASDGAMIRYMSFTAETGIADLALYVIGDAKKLANGEAVELWFLLAVPDSMDFELGDGGPFLVEGGTRCGECGGTGNCSYCGGTGSYNYGDGLDECAACDGTGRCDICDGEGMY